jgi:hypothetical protein
MTEWVNVKDSLPKERERVLVSGGDGVLWAYHEHNGVVWQCCHQGIYAEDEIVYGVTHWMPLPEAPKE